MNELLATMLFLSLSGSFFIVALFLLKPIVRDRFGKIWQYYIWLVVIARLLLPFSLELSLFGRVFEGIESSIATRYQQQVAIESLPHTVNHKSASDTILISPSNANERSDHVLVPKTQAASITYLLSEISVLLLSNACSIWLVLAIVFLIRKVTIYQSFIRYVKAGRSEVSDIEQLELFGKLLEQEKINCAVELYTNTLISSPLLIGFFRPCIILPSTALSEVDFRNTILHELMHYKRLDMFYKWLVQLVICLHWFNPLVHFMGREVNHACELSCDEAVIAKFNAQEQRSYGNTLLTAFMLGNYNQALASLSLNEGKTFIKERLDSIMGFKKKSTMLRCAMFLVALVFLCGFSVTGTYAAKDHKNTESTVPKSNH